MTAPGRRFNDAVTRFWSLAAPIYDLPALQRWIYRPPQDEVVSALRTRGVRKVADIACGTGILASRIRSELDIDDVYGVDLSDGMLEEARARDSRVQWLKAPAEKLPFDDGALDAVVSTTAFHFFDQPAAMREFHRVLAPGGVAVVATISPAQPALLQWFSGGPLDLAHATSPAEMRDLFTGAGFGHVTQHRPPRPLWTRFVGDLITMGTTGPAGG